MKSEWSIIVVGAGIMGVCIAENLRRLGQEVLLIDKVSPGDQHQASYGNAGILARSAIVPVSAPGIISKIPSMILNPESPLFLKWRYLPKLMPWLAEFLMNSREAKVREISSALDILIGDTVEQHISLSKGTPAEKFIREGDWTYYYKNNHYLRYCQQNDLFYHHPSYLSQGTAAHILIYQINTSFQKARLILVSLNIRCSNLFLRLVSPSVPTSFGVRP